MAMAVKWVKTVTRPRKTYTMLDSVTLTLSREEARTLGAVLNNIGGDPYHTARKYTNQIQEALFTAAPSTNIFDIARGGSSLQFGDGSLEAVENKKKEG